MPDRQKIKRTYHIVPHESAMGEFSFTMEDEQGNEVTELEFDKNKDNNDKNKKASKQDYYEIKFKLPKDYKKLAFSRDREIVLIASSTKVMKKDPDGNDIACADENNPDMDMIFFVHPRKKIKDTELVVINTDPDKETFYFAFNFTKGDGNPGYVTYDPIGRNEDGGISGFNLFSKTSVYLFAFGAISSAAAIYFSNYLQ